MQKFSIEIKWAIILTILYILWSFFEKQLGLHDEKISKHMLYNILFTLVAFAAYILGIKEKKRIFFQNDMTWAQGFVSGAIMSVITAILSPLVTLITYKVISPNYFQIAISNAVSKGAPLANAEMYFNMESYMLQNAFTALSMGLVISSIVSLFTKSKKSY